MSEPTVEVTVDVPEETPEETPAPETPDNTIVISDSDGSGDAETSELFRHVERISALENTLGELNAKLDQLAASQVATVAIAETAVGTTEEIAAEMAAGDEDEIEPRRSHPWFRGIDEWRDR